MTTATVVPAPFKKIEEQRFEFTLYINDTKIICQRYFNIRDFDEKYNSADMKELLDNIVGMNTDDIGGLGIIPNRLKEKSVDYLWDNFNPYFVQETSTNLGTDKEDVFQFEIKIDKIVVGKAQFPGTIFPPKVRYQVDIKDIIPQIMSEIRYYLSVKK